MVIQDHGAGHNFGQGGIGDQGPHFNIRPIENTVVTPIDLFSI
ncbi:hypothetical protein CTT35_15410 [Photobacterium damselae]|nr:hypothetical protein CTT35_15410 [Photobacterium damselae]PSW76081.1 hypothetical protein CTT37_16010 [Photobacterium damselae]